MADEHPRLFDPDRYSPVSVQLILELPQSNARSFWIASALGWFIGEDGKPVRGGRDALGVLVTKRRQRAILLALGENGKPLSPQRWRALLADWERRQAAHRCAPGTAFLFTRPGWLYAECPNCHELTYASERVPAERKRGPGFADDSRLHHERQALVPQAPNATTTSVPAPLAQARLSTARTHQETGEQLGRKRGEGGVSESMEIGVQGALGVEEPNSAHTSTTTEAAACPCGHADWMHFLSGVCSRPACPCEEGRPS